MNPTTADAFQRTLSGFGDAFLSVLNATGTGLLYSTYTAEAAMPEV